MNNNHVVIMAGGIGSRFWPMSTPGKPKQFIDILGTGKTLLQATVERFRGICPLENVWVVTSRKFGELVKEQLPGVPDSNILLEPCMRNTAPCVAYVTWKIKKKHPYANLVISASDHVVTDPGEFERVIRKGLDFTAGGDRILTLGMKPTRPETGYGYIEVKKGTEKGEIQKVERFKEKPDRATAEIYLKSGNYTWNSGIFLWTAETVTKAFRNYQPALAALFDGLDAYFYTPEEQERVDEKFPQCEKISVDYAIMEQASNIFVFSADFGWSDLGTWGSLHELSVKDSGENAVVGPQVKLIECKDCIVRVEGGMKMVLQGLEGYIVAEKDGVFLICKKEEEQRIKEFSEGV